MPAITLKEMKVGVTEDLHKKVIDEFRTNDWLFDNIPFDPIANPVSNGSGWVASVMKVKDEATADFRDYNGVYTETKETYDTVSIEPKIFGNKIKLDRSSRNVSNLENLVEQQIKAAVKAIKKGLSYNIINASSSVEGKQFDGIDVLLKSSKTEVLADTSGFDISTYDKQKENAGKFEAIMLGFLGQLDRKPDALLVNTKVAIALKVMAKERGLHTEVQDGFGKFISAYDGIPIVELKKEGSLEPTPIIGDNTSLYAVSFGEDALKLVGPNNGAMIDAVLPNFKVAGEQAYGLCEAVVAPIIVNANSCGVLRNLKIK